MLNPLALPIHPILVHFSIAMLSVAWICLIVSYSTGDRRWDDRSRLFEVVGMIALPLTIVSAFIDTRGFGFIVHPRTDAPLIWHMVSGLVATAAFTVHYAWRRNRTSASLIGGVAAVDVGLATFGMIALVAAGLLGSTMVYGT